MVNYISIKQVVDDLYDHPMLQDIPFERIINHAVHFIKIVGIPNSFIEKTAILEIQDYRAALPCDFLKMNQVRTYAENDDHPAYFRYADNTFHMSDIKPYHHIGEIDLTYKIQNSCIITSIKEGAIEISYQAIRVDSEGYPMVPENSSYIEALELYIKKKVFTVLFDQGKLNSAILQNVQQEYAFKVGQAQTSLIMPTIDQMESITGMMNQLIARTNEHKKGFMTLGSREYIKTH